MSVEQEAMKYQMKLIEDAMKKAGVWSSEVPEWVSNFKEDTVVDIWQWLQFIHFPMRLNNSSKKTTYIAPRVSQHINGSPEKHHILQLVIELDSITSTF